MPTTFLEYLSDSLLRAGSERALDRRELEQGIATESIDSPGYATTARGREGRETGRVRGPLARLAAAPAHLRGRFRPRRMSLIGWFRRG